METQEIYNLLIEIFNENFEDGSLPAYLENVELTPNMRIDDLGLDSISKVGLVASLMEKTDSYLPYSIFLDNPSLWDIADRTKNEVSL